MRNCNNDFILNVQTNKKCNRCDKDYECAIKFFKDPCWLICEIDAQTEAHIESLPKSIMLNKKLYNLLCATYHDGIAHFKAIFLLNNKFYVVDDRNSTHINEEIPMHSITTCFYYLSQ